MTTKQLNYKALPIIAAADGATSPALTANDKGAMAFSTTTNKPMSWDGTKWNLLTKVDSVAGRTGAVTVTKTDVGLGSVDNVSAASLRDRTTHTGEQPISSVTGLQTALDDKSATTHTHAVATASIAGFMSGADKSKLDGIAAGANAYIHPSNDGNLHVPATGTTNANKVLKAGATAGSLTWGNVAFSEITNRPFTLSGFGITDAALATHTHGTVTSTQSGFISSEDKAKLDGIATGATANSTDAALRNRATHTGAQAIATVTGLQAALDGKAATSHTHDNATTSAAGFMSNTDKIKLDKIIANDQQGLNTQDGWGVSVGSFAMGSGNIDRSVAVGSYALNKGGRDIVAIGYRACVDNVTGFQNVGIGTFSLRSSTGGSYNTAIGYGSGEYTVGNTNVCIGVYAGSNCGSDNVAIGNRALQYWSGSNNIGIGNTSSGSTSGNNNIVIGQGTPVFAITGATSNHIVMGSNAVTNAYIKVAWTVVSDARDKTNFAAIPHGLEFVKQLKPTAYQFKLSRDSEKTNGGVRYGFKAQDIAAIEPEGVIVDTSDKDLLRYNESNLIPVLVKAIQELSAEVERLKNAITNS